VKNVEAARSGLRSAPEHRSRGTSSSTELYGTTSVETEILSCPYGTITPGGSTIAVSAFVPSELPFEPATPSQRFASPASRRRGLAEVWFERLGLRPVESDRSSVSQVAAGMICQTCLGPRREYYHRNMKVRLRLSFRSIASPRKRTHQGSGVQSADRKHREIR